MAGVTLEPRHQALELHAAPLQALEVGLPSSSRNLARLSL